MLGGGNLANIMLQKQGDQLVGGVAIDQNVNIQTEPKGIDFVMGFNPMKVIEGIVTKAIEGSQETATKVWKELPKAMKKLLLGEKEDKDIWIDMLHKSIIAGFQLIKSRITPETILRLHEELSPLYSKDDTVDTKALLGSLKIISSVE